MPGIVHGFGHTQGTRKRAAVTDELTCEDKILLPWLELLRRQHLKKLVLKRSKKAKPVKTQRFPGRFGPKFGGEIHVFGYIVNS